MIKRCISLFVTTVVVLFSLSAEAQISGTVSDDKGAPLSFANVYIQGTTIGTTCNEKGEYKLTPSAGQITIGYQYIGFKQQFKKISYSGQPTKIDMVLQEESYELKEFVINANDEDPAYRIIREAQKNRKKNQQNLDVYSCTNYSKALFKMDETPKKFMGQDIGTMDGMLDSAGKGILYLSESLATIYKGKGNDYKEVVHASKVSGEKYGYSYNNFLKLRFDLYENSIRLNKDVISPIGGSAMTFYKYKLDGTFTDADGNYIYKINVYPKRSFEPCYSGTIYIVDKSFAIYGTELALKGENIQQDLFDSITIRQSFFHLKNDDSWPQASQTVMMKAKLLVFKFSGFFNNVYSDYNFKPDYSSDFFKKDAIVFEKDTLRAVPHVWDSIRPLPLTSEEIRDYVKKDSLSKVWSSKEYLDSLSKAGSKFKFMDIIGGYTYYNYYKGVKISTGSLLNEIGFNPVQGLKIGLNPEISFIKDTLGQKISNTISLRGQYGFADGIFRANGSYQHRDQLKYMSYGISFGYKEMQNYSPEHTLSNLFSNYLYLIRKDNRNRWYENTYVQIDARKRINRLIELKSAMSYETHFTLENNTEYSFKRKDQLYAANDSYGYLTNTDGIPNIPVLNYHQTFKFNLEASFRPGVKQIVYPERVVYSGTKWPLFTVGYTGAFPINRKQAWSEYNYAYANISKSYIKTGFLGYSDFYLAGGYFIGEKPYYAEDYAFFAGNRVYLASGLDYSRTFINGYYYSLSDNRYNVQFHYQQHLNGLILGKIPLIKRLGFGEVLKVASLKTGSLSNYTELSAGIENIGFGIIRLLRFDYVFTFLNGKHLENSYLFGLTIDL